MVRHPRLLWAGAVLVVLGTWVAFAVVRDPPPVDLTGIAHPRNPSVEAACRRFATALPDDLGGLDRRRSTSGTPLGYAAYGDPEIVIRCGVPVFTRYQPGDELIVINGVQWDIDELDGGGLRCSLPRALVNVEVSIPGRYKAERLALLTDAVKQAQPL
ncbi:MAG TPA: DUF3515 domain-containing protein [Mycobacteriales bacterium]|nr:DUF3515 domain-containing protein [Mycobacteriales bacterium]